MRFASCFAGELMKRRHLLLLIALIVPILICSNALFAQPLVTGVEPNRGPTGGGTLVTITGSDFSNATSVTFGGRGLGDGVRHDNCYLSLPCASVGELWHGDRGSNTRVPCIMSSPAETRGKEFLSMTTIADTIWIFFWR